MSDPKWRVGQFLLHDQFAKFTTPNNPRDVVMIYDQKYSEVLGWRYGVAYCQYESKKDHRYILAGGMSFSHNEDCFCVPTDPLLAIECRYSEYLHRIDVLKGETEYREQQAAALRAALAVIDGKE